MSAIYVFIREGHFYPLQLGSDEEARANAECNPGTVRVETTGGRVVWEPNDASPPTAGEAE